MAGWVKLHRMLQAWEWYNDSQTLHVFITILLNANHEDGRWKGHEVKRGQWITGRKKLAEITGITERSIRTILKRLEDSQELTIKPTSKFSVISVTKWDSYQVIEQVNDQPKANKRPATDQPPTTNKKVKKEPLVCDEEDLRLAEWIYGLILNVAPSAKKPNFKSWANTIRLMRECDNLTRHRIAEVFKWANGDTFWMTNILSPAKLREQYAQLEAKMDNGDGTRLTPQQAQFESKGYLD